MMERWGDGGGEGERGQRENLPTPTFDSAVRFVVQVGGARRRRHLPLPARKRCRSDEKGLRS